MQCSHIFRSYGSLGGFVAGSHLDDLESIYWILCFIIAHHDGPDLATSRLAKTPSVLVGWLSEDEWSAVIAKNSHLTEDFNLPVQDWFRPLEPLARSLHSFFQSRILARDEARRLGEALPLPDAREDYEKFVAMFSQAIQAVEWPAGVIFNDEFDGDVENVFHVPPKRELDDPDPPRQSPPKRVRIRDRNIGPTIEIVDWIMSEAGHIVETAFVLRI